MKRCLLLLPLLIGLHLRAAEPRLLHAGAAAVDITPHEFPLNLPGGFSGNEARVVHDPLHARALVLADGKTSMALVVIDNLGLGRETCDKAKALASERTGIPVEHMLFASTHTHSAPSSGSPRTGPEKIYHRQLVNGIVEAIEQAGKKLEPAQVAGGGHDLPEEVFNRRWYLKPGKMPLNPFGEMDRVKMNPGRSAEVLDRPAGPTDPQLLVLSVQNAKRQPLALFANYSLHYVGGVPRGTVSADYYGEFARLMPSRLKAGDGFVAMMANGTSGDINNIPFQVDRPPRESFEQIRVVARKAADTAWRASRGLAAHETRVPLGMKQRVISLNYRKPPEDLLKRADKILSTTDETELAALPRLAEIYARRTVNLAKAGETIEVPLQAARVGDFAICAIPFETLVEIGLEIKTESPFPRTMVIGLANGYNGYLPTPRQHELGGYETWWGTCKVQKDASEVITQNLLEMLADLKTGQ